MSGLISYQVLHQSMNWSGLPKRRVHWLGNDKLPGRPEGSKFEISFDAHELNKLACKALHKRPIQLTVDDLCNLVQAAFCQDITVASISFEDYGKVIARVWYRPCRTAFQFVDRYGEPDSNAYRQYQHDNDN